jgi:hypothetical protein
LRRTRGIAVALVIGGDVLDASAIAEERAVPVLIGLAADGPPPRISLGGNAHGEIGKFRAGAQQERQRSFGSFFAAVLLEREERGEWPADKLFVAHLEGLCRGRRQIDQAILFVRRPEPGDSGGLEVIEQLEAALVVLHADRLQRRRGGFVTGGGLASEAPQNAAHRHLPGNSLNSNSKID